jgi:hypothetical protein
VTKLSPEAIEAVRLTGEAWADFKKESIDADKRLRAALEAQLAAAVKDAEMEVAYRAQAALDLGATKVALRRVTSVHPGTLERYLALVAPTDIAAVVPQRIGNAPTFEYETPDIIRITVDPAGVVDTSFSKDDERLWSGPFKVMTRPSDGRVVILPVDSGIEADGAAVAKWLRDDPANLAEVTEWVSESQQAA